MRTRRGPRTPGARQPLRQRGDHNHAQSLDAEGEGLDTVSRVTPGFPLFQSLIIESNEIRKQQFTDRTSVTQNIKVINTSRELGGETF